MQNGRLHFTYSLKRPLLQQGSGLGRSNLDSCLLEYQGNERTKEVLNQSEEANKNKDGGFPGLIRKGEES